ncbi:Chromosomal replication initiator protein DnaA [Roseibacterium elongatum DSM 19469]|uniref:Chromosomal replication initiator protein DnaA n=1 Tax=Roseicyclus elongatus DSM 19469 TaxID=1294273 RepID=W8RP04_9RHOB|nr:DnaA/Hda family protein [Roseibacterium elongatum]AHM02738.1 Chromosomal replication initiator protein DnaA [Roseibacterium elongatum DSM 19469]
MAEQLVFELALRPAMGREDFFVSAANAGAVAQIDAWRDWPHGKLVLAGPEGAGKTHLAHVWAGMTGAVLVEAGDLDDRVAEEHADAPALVVENAHRLAGQPAREAALFHLHNALIQRAAPTLFTATDGPERWGLGLPDLDSRMRQAGLARVAPPDDALLMAVMMKLAHDRALPLTPKTLAHVAPRIERSFAAVRAFVDALDARALAAKRPPRFKDAKAVLAEMKQPVSR